MKSSEHFGLSCAMLTPFAGNGGIDLPTFADHAMYLLRSGCDSVTVFGTTGEGPSISTSEREQCYAALAKAGIDLRQKVIGSIIIGPREDAVAQAQMCYAMGCRAILLAPPFYFPEPSEEGLFAWFASVIERLGSTARDIILYHIPQFTKAAISNSLVRRLETAYPGIVIGVKDSRGVWEETKERILALPGKAVLVGNEMDLASAVKMGGKGSICGFANFIPRSLRMVAWEGREHPEVMRLEKVISGLHFLAAFKILMAAKYNNPIWLNLRAPLSPLSAEEAQAVVARWKEYFPANAA